MNRNTLSWRTGVLVLANEFTAKMLFITVERPLACDTVAVDQLIDWLSHRFHPTVRKLLGLAAPGRADQRAGGYRP